MLDDHKFCIPLWAELPFGGSKKSPASPVNSESPLVEHSATECKVLIDMLAAGCWLLVADCCPAVD